MSTHNPRKHSQANLFSAAILLAAFAAVTATAGLAIAKPTKPASVPHEAPPLQQRLDDIAAPLDKGVERRDDAAPQAEQTAYLGVSVNPLGNRTAQRLGLPNETGLRLMQVVPASPAEKAGLMPGDVLTHLGDQILINPPQFAVLIRTHQPGDVMTVRLIRDGEAVKLDAKLGGRAIAPENPPMAVPGLIPGAEVELIGPPVDMDDIFELMQRQMNMQRGEMDQIMDQMRRQMQLDLGQLELDGLDQLDGVPQIELRPGMHGMRSNIMINDGEHAIHLKTNGDERHLTVKAADGEVLFDGVMPEDGQIEGLPEALQQKIDGLMNNNRIELRINPAPQRKAEPKGPVA